MITTAQLKDERGWMDTLIQLFLPSADETRQNPHYRKAAPMRLDRICRVEEIESSQACKEAVAKAAERKASSQKGVERKRKGTLEWAASLPPPTLAPRTQEELLAQAVQHDNNLWLARGNDEKHASPHDSPEFLERMTVNFVRHE